MHWSKVICYVDMVVKISSISIDLFDFWWRFSVDMPAILDHSAILTQYQALFQAKQRLSHWKTTHQRKKRVKKREGVEKFSKADNKIDKSIACTFSLHNPIAILLFFFLCCVCVICQKQKKKNAISTYDFIWCRNVDFWPNAYESMFCRLILGSVTFEFFWPNELFFFGLLVRFLDAK